jgi:hypothetical protein
VKYLNELWGINTAYLTVGYKYRLLSGVLTSTTNLLALQKRITEVVTGNFEFRNTRSGTRIVSKEVTDFSAIRKHLEENNLSYFTFFPKSEKPIKAVIRHLPANTPAQDISEALVDLGFDTINVKQMTSRRSNLEGPTPRQPPCSSSHSLEQRSQRRSSSLRPSATL